MARRRFQPIVSAGIVALSAVALAVPSVASACGEGLGDSYCCCTSRDVAASTNCHDETPSSTGCVTKSCPCCRPAVPQNFPPESKSIQLTFAAATALVPWFHGGTEFSTRIVGNPPANLAAIPHRILHCSWLI